MQTLMQFDFCTIVCNGCGARIDSLVNGERLLEEDELEENIEENGWTKDPSNKDKWLCKSCTEYETHRKYPGEGRTIIEPEKLFGVRCDICGKIYDDRFDTGCTHWEDDYCAIEKARDDGWNEIDGKIYCEDCWYYNEDVSDEEFEKTEGDYAREKPLASDECSEKCPYFSKDTLHYHCSLPRTGEEVKKCPRLIEWETKKRKEVEEKNHKIEENVRNHVKDGK